MLIDRELVVPVSEAEALARADVRLRRVGFAPVPGQHGVYVRGSWFGSTLSSDPSHMLTRITVLFAPVEGGTRVRVLHKVGLVGQILTAPDVLFWEEELESLDEEIRTGGPQAPNWRWARRAAFSGALVQMLAVFIPIWPALIFGWLLGPAGLALAYFFGMAAVFALGVWKLRLGMKSPLALSTRHAEPLVASAAAAAPFEARGEAEAEIDPERLALEDFERRLFGDNPEAVRALIEANEIDEEALEERVVGLDVKRR